MEQKRFWNKNVKKFFTKSNEINRIISDDIVIVTNNKTSEPSTSTITSTENIEVIENVTDYFTSDKILELLSNSTNVLFFKLQIKDISSKPNPTEVIELAEKCSKNAIVLFLAIKNDEKFYFYWKSKDIQQFLELKLYDNCDFFNDLKLFEFIANFVTESLKHGHLGIHSAFPAIKSSTKIELHLLADHRNFNLLLVAAELGDLYIVNFLLDASCTTEYRGINAQTLAYENHHFEVLFSLLKSNLTYPQLIDIQNCPDYIQEFSHISLSLNEAMIMRDSEKVLEMLAQNPQLRHFYNLSNESAPAFALRHKLWDMYGILISKNISLGPREKFSELKKDMKEKEREELREIHYVESKFLPDNHMHVLISNSRLAPGTTQHDQKYEIIQNAFEILNQIPLIQIILMIVAASRNFRIVFDFNQGSVEQIDPTADGQARGTFYTSGRIYVAAKQLLNSGTKFEALGTLAHELCHCAMNLVYKNLASPYSIGDSVAEQEFEDVSRVCKTNCEHEEIISLVYSCYSSQVQHAELIVRVPHLIMHYSNSPERFEEVKGVFKKLFEFFESKIVPELKKALPIIEAKAEGQDRKNRIRIRNLTLVSICVGLVAILGIIAAIVVPLVIYTPTYNFTELSDNEQKMVYKAPIRYKGIDLELHNLFPEKLAVYKTLTSDHISQIFSGKILHLDDPHLRYLEQQVRHDWQNLTSKLQQKILNSNFTFQNESLKFSNLNDVNSKAFNSLSSDQIIDILDGKKLIINDMVNSLTKFYFERNFWEENILEVYFKFMKFVVDGKDYTCFSFNKTKTNKTFESFYFDFKRQDALTQLNKIQEIRQALAYKRCSDFKIASGNSVNASDTLMSHKSLQLTYDQVLKTAFHTKLFILSGEAGTGKTVTFEQFTMRIKRKFPTFWVSYIDLKDYKHLYKKIQTLQDVKNMLGKIFKLSAKNEFERKIFQYSFDSRNLILLWNGFDEISPEFSDDVTRILKLIKDESQNIQFVCTRPLYSDQLKLSLSVESYTLVQLDKDEQESFLTMYLRAENVDPLKTQDYLEKIQKIVDSLIPTEPVDTPLMLGMITQLIANDVQIYDSENLYEIYQKFVLKKVEIWRNGTEFGRKFIEDSFIKYRHFDVVKLYQSYALKIDFKFNGRAFLSASKLKVMHQDIPSELTNDEVSRMGILYINGPKNFKFAHKTFEEFFTAQYFIDHIYKADDNPTDLEAELRILVLDYSSEYIGIKKFIKHFLSSKTLKESKTFDPQISKALTSKHPNIISNDVNNFYLIEFFKKDPNVLKSLLKIDKSETVYTRFFNYEDTDTLAIKNAIKPHLNDNELTMLIRGTDQKGAILFSSYCKHRTRRYSGTNMIHEYYKVDDELMANHDPTHVLESIAKNLTKNEFKELLASVIVFSSEPYRDLDFPPIFYEKMWNLIDVKIDESEQEEIIAKFLTSAIYNIYEDILNLSLQKCHTIMTNDKIFEFFQKNNILYDYEHFDMLWTFFVKHSVHERQKELLNQTKLCELEKCYPCGLLFHPHFDFLSMKAMYESYFNKTELQNYVLSHSSDVLSLIVSKSEVFDNIFDFLRETFINNEKSLREFLLREIKPTKLNIFKLFESFDDPRGNLQKLSLLLKLNVSNGIN